MTCLLWRFRHRFCHVNPNIAIMFIDLLNKHKNAKFQFLAEKLTNHKTAASPLLIFFFKFRKSANTAASRYQSLYNRLCQLYTQRYNLLTLYVLNLVPAD